MEGIIGNPDHKQPTKEKKLWKSSGWTIDPYERQVMGPCLLRMDSFKIRLELDLQFLLVNNVIDTLIPDTNDYAKIQNSRWSELDF